MCKKYTLLDDKFTTVRNMSIGDPSITPIKFECHKLFRIMALDDFSDVKKGDLGGYVESEDNLSQMGDCWIYDNSKVFGRACVYENAKVSGSSIINDHANIEGDARVMESSNVRGFCSTIKGNAIIRDNSIIDNSCIGDNAVIKKSKLEWSSVYYDSVIKDVALLFNANIKWDGYITKDEDCVTISGLRVPNYNDSSLRHPHYTDDITFYRKKYNQVGVVIHHGICYNTLKEFDKVVKENHEKGNYTYDQAFPFIIEAMKRHFYPYNYCRK